MFSFIIKAYLRKIKILFVPIRDYMFIPIKKLVGKSLKKFGVAEAVEKSLVLEEFSKIIKELLGTKSIKRIRPLYVKNNVLTIACLSSVAAQEIKLHEREITGRINKKFKKEMIKELRFVL